MSDKDKSTGGDEALFDAAARRTLRLRDGGDAAEHAAWLAAGPGRAEAMAEADHILSHRRGYGAPGRCDVPAATSARRRCCRRPAP